MASYIVGNIGNSHLPAYGRNEASTEHICGACRTPFGKSSIPCKNEPKEADRD